MVDRCARKQFAHAKDADSAQLDDLRLAALKVSDGNLQKLERAVQLARIDWRDLLVGAGFAADVRAHLK